MPVEDQIIDSFNQEDNRFIDLFSPDRMKELFSTFKEAWQDSAKREEYETLKTDLGEKYMIDPAKYVGFIEESPEMHKDVISAADETGVDPAFLYNVAMQEGLSRDVNKNLESGINIYESDRIESTLNVGMDKIFKEQDLAIQRDYLKEKISGVTASGRDPKYFGNISSKDVLRGTGAMLQLNKDYLTNSFKKDAIDFNSLPEDTQQFWIYSAYNAGAGEAYKLFKTYGVDPFSNPEFIAKIESQQELGEKRDIPWEEMKKMTPKEYKALSQQEYEKISLSKWMKNVGRVVGGIELTKMYSPFSNRLYE